MRFLLRSALTISCGLSVLASVAHAQNLNDDLLDLVKTHPLIVSQREELKSLGYSVDESEAAFLPRLSLYGDSGAEHVDNPSRRSSGLDSSRLRRDKVTLTLTQNLFNGYADVNNVKSSEANYRATEYLLKDTIRQEMLRGIIAYIDVLKFAKMVKLSKDRELTIMEQLQLENERVERGSGIAVDVLEAKSRLRKAKEKTVANVQKLEAAEASYERAFGRLPNAAEMDDVMPPKDLLPFTLDEAISLALGNRGTILSSKEFSRGLEHVKEATKSEYYPSVDLVSSYDYEDNVSATRGIARTGSIIVQANWELFSGFATDSRVAAAAEMENSVKNSVRNERRKAEEEVKKAWSELERGQERYDLLVSAVDIAEEVFDSRKRLQDAGKETTINVLDAESQVYDSHISLIEMDYVSRAAVYKVLAAAGMLTPENLGL
ncbi:MAG: TolC family protein [Alphaproteobacteria bacterium]|nr:TolC family protein [Alphaproteobacteria bacterium]